MNPNDKNPSNAVLVAGASSGLGRAVARQLALDGYTVYAAARSFSLGVEPPEGCRALPLDVRNQASVTDAVRTVVDAEGGLYALVNCAAYLTLGACEETDPTALDTVMDTTFFGTVRLCRAVLPFFRAQGYGRIVNFSSINGRLGIPFQSAYVAAKHAIEGYSECLAQEVRAFGVDVSVIEPGDCRHGSSKYRGHAKTAEAADSPYRERYQGAVARIEADENGGMLPDVIARAVSRLLRQRTPPMRRLVARPDQRLAVYLHTVLPGRWFNRIMERYYAPRKESK